MLKLAKSTFLLFEAAMFVQIWFQMRMLKTKSHLTEKCPKLIPNVEQKAPQKHTKKQYQTVISDFGRALVRVLSPPPWSWILTAAWGAGCRPKGVQTGWSIRLEWHTRVTCEALLAHRSASSTPETLEPPTAGIIFRTSLDSL